MVGMDSVVDIAVACWCGGRERGNSCLGLLGGDKDNLSRGIKEIVDVRLQVFHPPGQGGMDPWDESQPPSNRN